MLKGIALDRAVGGRAILRDINVNLDKGSITAVLGPSGSGKTSLLRLIMGLDQADAGELLLDGRRLAGPGFHVAPERRPFSLVFQEFTLFPHMDVHDNLTFGMSGGSAEAALADELLALLEIAPLKRRRIDHLSGGEQQRVALARALAVRPRLLLLDEPFSNVDRMLRDHLYERFKAFLLRHDITTLLATHDHAEAFYFSDRIIVLKDGVVIDDNVPRHVYHHPRNAWVAGFFGTANLIPGEAIVRLCPDMKATAASYLLRPEAFELVAPAPDRIAGVVREVGYYGSYQDVHLRLDTGLDLRVRDTAPKAVVPDSRVGVRLRPGFTPHPLENGESS